MKNSKLIRVEMEYANGEVHTLKGKKAQEWLDACNSQVMMGWAHGQTLPRFNWKIVKNKK